jgi:hypothetical protein
MQCPAMADTLFQHTEIRDASLRLGELRRILSNYPLYKK